MKKFKNCGLLLTIAAALTMTTISCSSDDTLTATPEQPQVTNGVQVTVGVSLADDATTRSEVEESTDANGKKHTLKFTSYDQLYVFGEIDGETRVAGLLDMKNGTLSPDGKSAKFTGTIKAYNHGGSEKEYNFGGSDPLALCAQPAATGTVVQEGNPLGAVTISEGYPVQIVYSNMVAANVNTLMAEELYVHGAYVSSTKSFALSCNAPIINCTISGLTANTYYRACLKKDGSGSDGVIIKTDANGVGAFAFGTRHTGSGAYSIEIKDNSSSTLFGTIDLGTRTLTGKVYNVSRHWTGSAFSKTIDLSTITSDLLVGSGMTLTGTLGGNYKVSIAAGATVTLSDATIPGRVANDASTWWAGLTCLGDATIVLADGTVNYVRGCHDSMPGIQAGPTGTTLTIRGGSAGTGKLTAETGLYNDGNIIEGSSAGIGGGKDMSVGNIRIEGGDITATANNRAAGIGSGYAENADASCGDITITGGTVTATGGYQGAGIGSGIGSDIGGVHYSSCGDITITGGTVYATGGDKAAGIGSGDNDSSCGNISITGTATGWAQGGTNSPRNIGKGHGDNASCGMVSVTAANFNDGKIATHITATIYIRTSTSLTKTCEVITITIAGTTYTFNNPTFGTGTFRGATLNFDVPYPINNAAVTITATGGECSPDTYECTTTWNIVSGDNYFDANLYVKQ